MQRFTDLRAWQRAHLLALDVYKLTRSFPADERYGLKSQVRRAAVSIPTNLAEGSKRRQRTDYARFINIAEGSAAELQSLLLLARDLGFASREATGVLLNSLVPIAVMLHRLRESVESAERRGAKKPSRETPSNPSTL